MTVVKLYQFSKEKNSTKQPTTAVASISGVFLASTSIESPSVMFDLNYSTAQEESTYKPYLECNYAYIDDFKRYYFIDNWTFDGRGKWIASMTVDAMATYKTEIGRSTQYIFRSAYASNPDITDTQYSTRGISTTRRQSIIWGAAGTGDVDFINGRKIVIGVNGTFGDADGFVGIGNATDLWGSASYFSTDQSGAGFFSSNIRYNFGTAINALQYIYAYHYLPFEPDTITPEHSEKINFSAVKISDKDILLSDTIYDKRASAINAKTGTHKTTVLYLPRHPQSSTYGKYVNKSEYTRYTMNFPAFGSVEINADLVYNLESPNDYVTIDVHTDITSGSAVLTIKNGNIVLSQLFGNIAIPAELDQTGRDMRRISATVISGTLGVAAGAARAYAGDYAGGAMMIGSSVANVATSDAFLPQTFTMRGGGSSNISTTSGKIDLLAQYKLICDDDNARFGRPLCAARQISTLPGYIQTNTAHVHAATMLPSEQETIEAYMNGGFYYE